MRYHGKTCLVATMHEKERAIRPSFESLLGFQIESRSTEYRRTRHFHWGD